ncbi:alpha/beta fold hydrolase [Jiella pacifica]|uniref:Alpha/beta fold hydrolase n=1 Tax=Jiella pacifica TaxID=2696469 RepID=A0A6N9TAD5_9HYPH|nr:alpha/beta hydrolase [Jiella pacifica]NDW07512.1 alpha/beta fold hydrolase [Jiella pacifica]
MAARDRWFSQAILLLRVKVLQLSDRSIRPGATVDFTLLERDLHYRSTHIQTPDGLTIAVQDWGEGSGRRDVLFIHGFSQSHLCWLKQVSGKMSKVFRLVTYDNRGHGMSDKPMEPAFYRDPQRWADEVNAVITGSDLHRPILVVWSYAGRIALDYLTHYGDEGISGLVMVCATSSAGPGTAGPAAPLMRAMAERELAPSVEASVQFGRACFTTPPPQAEMEVFLACSAVTPNSVREALVGRPAEYAETLQKIDVPTLVIHGEQDRVLLPATAEHTARMVKNAKLLVYEGIGHTPFWEASDRFDADVTAFIESTT